ncbi:VCBS repeat-containing protein [Rheinheimera sp.]|uniref:FG-GAP repeat domain-containing protein n=1 Tax=Rheinheimera sp. TaxID=1869214 RepID=UPI0027BA07D5|nr:VCBS repeat-containing protein [Rheinheimera sp.]
MKVRTSLNPTLCLLFAFGVIGQAKAAGFDAKTVPLEHPANGQLLKLNNNPTLLVTGHNSEYRWLSAVDLTSNSARQLAIPQKAQFFQQANLAGFSGGQLVVLSTEGVLHYQPGKSEAPALSANPVLLTTDSQDNNAEKAPLLPHQDDKDGTGGAHGENGEWRSLFTSSSLYRVVDSKRLKLLDFSFDINNDKLSDFLLPDFNAYQLWMQQQDGSFRHFSLPVDSQMQAFDQDPTYLARKPWLADINLDGKTDITFTKDDTLLVFYQLADGNFATTAQQLTLGLGLTPDNQAQLRGGDGRSYQGLKISRLERLADINGDAVVDLVVQQQFYVDAMEQNYSYHLHYGEKTAGGVQFSAQPQQKINTSGVQFDVRFVDLDNDNKLDFYTPAAQIGVRSIIRALVAGTANVELQFYKQQADGSFGNKAVYQQDVTVEISIGNGSVNMPLATVLKTNKGQSMLVVGDGDDTLRSYGPVAAKIFSEKSTKQQLPMPKRGMEALVADLNNDGKEDLVLPYGSQENQPELNNQLQLLWQQ